MENMNDGSLVFIMQDMATCKGNGILFRGC